jgi:hypothetical protein
MRFRSQQADNKATGSKGDGTGQPHPKPRMPNRPSPRRWHRECSEEAEPLTAHDVISALGEQYASARCTIFEGARLRRSLFSWGRWHADLSRDERNLDTALAQAAEDLESANHSIENMCVNSETWIDDSDRAGGEFKADLGKLLF